MSSLRTLADGVAHVGAMTRLMLSATYFATLGPLLGRSKLRRQLAPLLVEVGLGSLPIVGLVSFLMGAILVLQTGEVLRAYGQISEVPGLVATSMTRELGPLMTAFILTARVGASYTAVLAAMKLNEEVLALETMAIHPVGFLVAPRLVSMLLMIPCLTALSFLLGIAGGALVAYTNYEIGFNAYMDKTFAYLGPGDLVAGLLKGTSFGVIITAVCCHCGLSARGGPMGLGRYTTTAVVSSMVLIVITDAVLTAFSIHYIL